MRRTIMRAGVALLASAWLVAAAQAPAADPQQPDLAKAQAAQQLSQPLNNQPVWKEVRSGAQQYTSLPGRETSVLIAAIIGVVFLLIVYALPTGVVGLWERVSRRKAEPPVAPQVQT